MFQPLRLLFLLLVFAPLACPAGDSLQYLRGLSLQLLETAPDSAIGYLNEGLFQSQRRADSESEAWFSMQKGSLFLNLKDSLKAREYFQHSYELYQALADKEGVARSQRYLAMAGGDPAHLQLALNFYEKTNDSLQITASLLDAARLAIVREDREAAFTYAGRALLNARALLNDDLTAASLLVMARLHYEAGEYKWLHAVARQMPTAAKRSSQTRMALWRARAFSEQNQSDSAEVVLSRIVGDKRLQLSSQAAALALLADVYQQAGDYRQTLQFLAVADSLRDIARNSSTENRVKLLEGEYHNRRKSEEIERLNSSLRQEWYQRLLLLGILAISGSFAVVIFRLQRQRLKRKKALLEHKRLQAEASQRLVSTTLHQKRLEEEVLRREIEERKSDLSHFARSFVHDKDVLKQLQSEIDRLKRSTADSGRRRKIAELSMSLMQLAQRDLPRRHLLDKTLELDDEAYFSLRESFPQLSDQDLELLVLILSGMKSSEIAGIYNIEKASLMTRRYRLRKKLGLAKGDELTQYVQQKLSTDAPA